MTNYLSIWVLDSFPGAPKSPKNTLVFSYFRPQERYHAYSGSPSVRIMDFGTSTQLQQRDFKEECGRSAGKFGIAFAGSHTQNVSSTWLSRDLGCASERPAILNRPSTRYHAPSKVVPSWVLYQISKCNKPCQNQRGTALDVQVVAPA